MEEKDVSRQPENTLEGQAECHITVIPLGKLRKDHQREHLIDCIEIRDQVFCIEQGVSHEIEQDGKDGESGHVLLWIQAEPAGTLRYRTMEEGIRIERVAILEPYRGCGYGRLLIQAGIQAARTDGLPGLCSLHAQLHTRPFYERLGFIAVGNQFLEADILHIEMVLPHQAEETLLGLVCHVPGVCI